MLRLWDLLGLVLSRGNVAELLPAGSRAVLVHQRAEQHGGQLGTSHLVLVLSVGLPLAPSNGSGEEEICEGILSTAVSSASPIELFWCS